VKEEQDDTLLNHGTIYFSVFWSGDYPQVRCRSTRPTRFLSFGPSQFHLSIFTESIHTVSVDCSYMLNLNVALRLLSGRLVGNHQYFNRLTKL